MPDDSGLEEDDLYIHSLGRNTYQAWRCDGTDPVVWTTLVEGKAYELSGDQRPRAFVMTEGGQPSWVLPDTVERAYKKLRHVQLQDAKGKSKGEY